MNLGLFALVALQIYGAAALLEFELENRYTLAYGRPGEQYPWLEGKKLAEPHRDTDLMVIEPVVGATYTWLIEGFEEFTSVGDERVTFRWDKVGTYKLVLTETRETGESMEVATDVVVKYVRREIRSLFPEDKNELLDTMKILWNLEKEEGQAIYGDDYTSITELLVYHLTLAGASDCDHMHDGYAFMQHHIALSGLFEQALQTINPSLSLPYWDYVYDIEEWASQDEVDRWDFTQGELFTSEYFGSTDPDTHYIKDGRWSHIQVPFTTDLNGAARYSTPHNTYGQMRAPWVANPDPHVMRAQTVCGQLSTVSEEEAGRCSSLQQLFAEENFADFGYYVSYMPHGRIHLLTGGVFGCDDTLTEMYDIGDLIMDEDFDISYAVSLAFAMHKNLYRYGEINCDESFSDCYCPDLANMLEDEVAMNRFLEAALFQLNMYKFNSDTKRKLVKLLCNSGTIDGDNLQSSSSYTPEFWPIHGTVERMFQVKALGWNGVEPFKDLEYPEQGSWLPYHSRNCYGHDAKDWVLNGMARIKVNGVNKLVTNQEFLDLMDPHEDGGLNYIYDHLSWEYCNAEYGVDVYNMEGVGPRGAPADPTNIYGIGGIVGAAAPVMPTSGKNGAGDLPQP